MMRNRGEGRSASGTARVRVLVVDDEAFARRLHEALPSTALDWSLEGGEVSPHLVLFGLPLPAHVERLRNLRRSLPVTVPIVVLVEGDDPADVDLAYAAGANSVVGRPSTAEVLARFLRAAALLWRPPR